MKSYLQKSFPPALRSCWIKLNAEFKKRLLKVGLTPDQYSVLRWIKEAHEDRLCQGELAKLMFTDANNISELVKRMEVMKLLVRTSAATDRRKKLLKISSKGVKLLQLSKPIAKALEEIILANLDRDEKERLLSMLRCVCQKLN